MTPRNLEAEMMVVGAAMFAPRTVALVELRPEHFSEPVYQDLWREILVRHNGGRLFDATAMAEWADRRLSDIGGRTHLLKLMEQGSSLLSGHARGYGELLRDLYRRRQLLEAIKGASVAAEAGESDGEAVQHALEQRLQEIAHEHADGDLWERIGVQAVESIERAELSETKGISTGFECLDAATGGIQPGTLWVVGGATSMGKSVMGAAIARNIAAQGYGVAAVHLEMDAVQVGLRESTALAFEADHRAENASYLNAQRGKLSRSQWDRLRGAARAAAGLPVWIDTRPGRSLSQIEASARRLFRKMERDGVGPGALVIDHEGLIAPEPGSRFPSQLERTNARSEGLLGIAKRLGVAVIALSQITKEGSRADGEERLPTAQDLNYGGALSQAATVVILLHRKAYYAERKPSHLRTEEDLDALRSRECTLVVDKARGGQRQQVKVLMDMPTAAVWEAK